MTASQSHSREEIAALAYRAALGAGLLPTHAEHAARATDWLRARGVEACDPLVALLFQHDETGLPPAGPAATGSLWQGAAGWLCPIACGASFADSGFRAPPRRELRLKRVALPVFLLPFAARLAREAGRPVALGWPGGSALTDGERVTLDTPPLIADITLRFDTEDRGPQARPYPPRTEPDQMILASLRIYAARADTREAPRPVQAVPKEQDQKGSR